MCDPFSGIFMARVKRAAKDTTVLWEDAAAIASHESPASLPTPVVFVFVAFHSRDALDHPTNWDKDGTLPRTPAYGSPAASTTPSKLTGFPGNDLSTSRLLIAPLRLNLHLPPIPSICQNPGAATLYVWLSDWPVAAIRCHVSKPFTLAAPDRGNSRPTSSCHIVIQVADTHQLKIGSRISQPASTATWAISRSRPAQFWITQSL